MKREVIITMKKALSMLLALAIAVSILVFPAFAAPGTNYTLTGNGADDIVAVALAQKGKTGADFNWNVDWCAYFTCWSGRTANLDFPKNNLGTPRHIALWFLNNNKGDFYCFRDKNYESLKSNGLKDLNKPVRTDRTSFHPKKGDLICFLWENAASNINWSHIGIVTQDYDGSGYIQTVEGNTSNKVTTNRRPYNATVVGFIRPYYKNNTPAEIDDTLHFSLPTDPAYINQQTIGDTNAVVVNKVEKNAGVRVNEAGVELFDENGKNIACNWFPVSDIVPDSATVYHSVFDINRYLNVTLSPGTTYRYRIMAKTKSGEQHGSTFTFTTTGTAPSASDPEPPASEPKPPASVPKPPASNPEPPTSAAKNPVYYSVSFNANGGSVSESRREVKEGTSIGTMPIPVRSSYTFDGWYSAASGGTKTEASYIPDGSITLYAHWSPVPTSTSNSNTSSASTSTPTSSKTSRYTQTDTWVKEGNTWYYLDSYGNRKTGWNKISGVWYYMYADGAMHTGWLYVSATWYYLNPDGSMHTGWLNTNGIWYYLNPDGSMHTGWLNVNGIWYYLSHDGAMQTGWLFLNGNWYYLNIDGAMLTGWQIVNGEWYYLNPDGSMQFGW